MIRDEVKRFVALGRLPSESDESLSVDQVDRRQAMLGQITRPVSDDEAKLLVTVFGDDDAFGLAWALLHLIETAPHTPIDSPPEEAANEWIRRIWSRERRTKR